MYRIVLYSLASMVTLVFALSIFGIFTYASPFTLALSFGLLSVVSFSVNQLLARVFRVEPNFESSIITTLILFFVLAVPSDLLGWAGIALAATVAIASKYVLTWRSSHIFNPAAFGVLAVSAIGIGNGAWWIADSLLTIPMLVVGFLVLYKLRRFTLFFAFAVPATMLIVLRAASGSSIGESLVDAVSLYPILFLGTIMLTEPHTMPTGQYDRLIYGALVGVMFAWPFDVGFIASSPHLALLIGNMYAFLVANRTAATLTLSEKKRLTPTTYAFSFTPDKPIARRAGQYMEFTLPGVKPNSRGNRRTFTIASAPSSELIELGVKFYSPSSAFKETLGAMKPGDRISASNVAGEFIVPKKLTRPLVFLAGGIGITPFIAMIRDMVSTGRTHQIDVYYFLNDLSEYAYADDLARASRHGIRVHTRVGKKTGLQKADLEHHRAADFYLSGPPGFVDAYRAQLRAANIHRVTTDYFTGY